MQHLVIDLDFLVDTQAVRNIHDKDAIEESLIRLVVLELVPLALVTVRHDDASVRKGGDCLSAVVVPLLRCHQQWVQGLDVCLEHLSKVHQALVGAVQATGITIGVRVI